MSAIYSLFAMGKSAHVIYVVGFRSRPEACSSESLETAAPLAFRSGLPNFLGTLSHFMHGDGLGGTSWRLSAISLPARMPCDASNDFVAALEQPIRFPIASATTNDHSLRLFIGSSPVKRLSPPRVSLTDRLLFDRYVRGLMVWPSANFGRL